jgi:putative flavoprotein involved in K+ transport
MGGYLEAYAARFALPVRTGARVDGLTRADGEFVVSSGTGGYRADNVVVATGAYQVPHVPDFAAALDPAIVQLHSTAYRNPTQLRGPVLVVGAGNSGAEIAFEAAALGPTVLSGRDTGQEPVRAGGRADRLFVPPFWFLLSRVLTTGSPLGRAARRQLSGRGLPLARVRRADLKAAGVERVPRVTGIRDGRPALADGRVLDVATVVWCTGFGSDFRWIDLPVFDAHGQPDHTRGIVPALPGLYFVGLFFLASAASPLIGGVGRDAGHVARHLVARRTDEPVPE